PESRSRPAARCRTSPGPSPPPSAPSPCSPLVPVQGAAPENVDVPQQQDEDEEGHLPEAGGSQVPEHHRPWEEIGRLDVEEDEEHRHEIEPHGEALACLLEQREAALVRGEIGSPPAR